MSPKQHFATTPRGRLLWTALRRLLPEGALLLPDPAALALGGVALALALEAPAESWLPVAEDLGELACEWAANSPIYDAADRAGCAHRAVRWDFHRGRWLRTCNHCNSPLEGRPAL